MLGRLLSGLVLAGFLVSPFVLGGCGPRCASDKTMSEMSEAQMAAESAEARAKALEEERISLQEEIPTKEAKVRDLESQRDALAEELRLLEAGY